MDVTTEALRLVACSIAVVLTTIKVCTDTLWPNWFKVRTGGTPGSPLP